MEYNKAKNLIKQTFEAAFDKERFRRFIINLLNEVDETTDATFIYRGGTMPKAFRPYVSSLQRLAKFEDESGKLVDVLVVKLKKESSLERARTMQRNLIGWYLNGSRGSVQKNAALAAFVSPESQDWRFSFVKMDYELVEKETGGATVEKIFTPARRYSFLVGENEHSHTAQQQLIDILKKDEDKPAFAALEEAFSIEPVTKRFYEEYRTLFHKLKEKLDALVEKDEAIEKDFEKHHIDTADFCKKLLGQIVFLYFLQKKGWFGVPKGGDWGTGPKQFLRELFEKKHTRYSNFFDDILEPLFYEALAKKRDDDYYSRFNCRIPFLNGGLFDPIQNYSWVNTDLLLPDSLFSNEDKTGILDVFDRYNFTVKENEPLEKEVAVDPEMLGKVFENLLEVKDRKSRGTYYTPREIVHYMCRESLINYLDTELDENVPTEDLETFVRYGEQAIQNDRQVERQGGETETYGYDIAKSVRAHARLIDEKLASVRICDPAAGSGAFLVGMMKEIVGKREALNSYLAKSSKRTIYNFKLNAIHNSLFGVDIDPGAVEIAKLRLWLSLVVEEEDIKNIKALPNLNYKIMQGNSLLEQYEGVKLIDERFFTQTKNNEQVIKQLEKQRSKAQSEYIKLHQSGKLTEQKKKELNKKLKKIPKRIKQYKNRRQPNGAIDDLFSDGRAHKKAEELLKSQNQFFGLSRRGEKQQMKQHIEQLSWELIELTLQEQHEEQKLAEVKALREKRQYPFFLWHLHFAEVFQKNKGFDVVIGNPPYIQLQKDGGWLADLYEGNKFETFERTGDIYMLFYEKGLDLLKQHGIHAFITSNKWMRSNYGETLRNYLSNLNPLQILDLGPGVFKNATVDTNILITKNERNEDILKAISIDENSKIKSLTSSTSYMNKIKINNKPWVILSNKAFSLKKKIEMNGQPLKNWDISIYRGITTGKNDAFVINDNLRKELIAEDPRSSEIVKSVLRGSDIKRYSVNFTDLWLINTHNGYRENQTKISRIDINNYPAIKSHLNKYYNGLKSRQDQGDSPYNLRNCAYLKEFEKEKIVFTKASSEQAFYLDKKDHFYLLNTAYLITGKHLKYILAILNSNFSRFIFKMFYQGGGISGEITKFAIENLPIPSISKSNQKLVEKIEKNVDKILQLKDKNHKANIIRYDKNLDKLVYCIYNLNNEEIALIEEAVNY